MARRLWVKIDVGMPKHHKLQTRPLVDRHLWTCLLCLAKESFPDGVIVGHNAASLATLYNLGSKRVVEMALEYLHSREMLALADGTITIKDFVEEQAVVKDTPAAVAARQRKWKATHKGNGRGNGTLTGASPVIGAVRRPVSGNAEVEEEVELEKERKEEKGSSSFSQDPEIARASQTDATPTEQAKIKHALGLDRKAARG